MKFPENPSAGMIFEFSSGIYYQYNSTTRSWFRINIPSIPLATPKNDGLMSSDDFTKLTGLIIPPPQISLSFNGSIPDTNGFIKIVGNDDGIIDIEAQDGNLHENTAALNFKINIEKLVQELSSLGQLRLTAPQGPQGPQGDPGEDGANSLPVGPQGDDGIDGTNASWPGALSEESFDVAQQNRAVVDITTRKVSADENYIVIKRANIGNINACPNTIIPQDIQSPWLLGFSSESRTPFTEIISPVSGQTCGWACNSDLYYFDIDAIIQGINTQFLSYLNSVKKQKEDLSETWLTAMQEEFNEQKAALCCALEACRSRGRNERTRQYIEQQRIQAALGDFRLLVGSDDDKVIPPGDDCKWNIPPTNFNLLHLSDKNCEIDWPNSCATDSLTKDFTVSGSYVQNESIPSVRVMSNIGVPNIDDLASGKYVNGTKYEDQESINWMWKHKDNPWVLVIWYCKSDHQHAARLFEEIDGYMFGSDSNVTACYQAGQIIDISGVKSGQSFSLLANNSTGSATVSIT